MKIIAMTFKKKFSSMLTAGNVAKVALIFFLITLPGVAEERWRLATFNCEFLSRKMVHIKYGYPLELNDEQQAEWTPELRESRFLEATRAVAEVIRGLEADVVGLTEAGPEADTEALLQELRTLGVHYPYHRVCDSLDTFTGQHVVLLSKHPISDFWPKLDGEKFYTPEPDDPEVEESTKISKALYARIGTAPHQLNLFLIHLRSERGGHESDQERVAQASLVRRHSLPFLERGEHVVVMGDLNDRRGQPALYRIRGRDDLYPDLIQTGHPQYFPDSKLSTRWTYEYKGERQQIDHILISRSLKGDGSSKARTRTAPMETKIGTTELPASDHRPLMVDIVWP